MAYENANPICQATLRPYKRGKTLSEYIRLCSEVDPTTQKIGHAIGAAFKQFSIQPSSSQNKLCFGCRQPGHFLRNCPNKKSRPRPRSPCPKCKQGFHWASECRQKARPGNWAQGQPQGPQSAPSPVSGAPQNHGPFNPSASSPQFAPSPMTGAPQNHGLFNPSAPNPSAEPSHTQPDWVSVPPPAQY